MNTIFITALSAALLPPPAPVPVRAAEEQPRTGKILVLVNGGTVEGDIERIDDRYRVVYRSSGEVWLPGGDRVLRLCASPEEAFTYLRGLVKANDVAGRMRLAEWCHEHKMDREALTETQAVLAVHKNHPQGRRLLALLEPQQATGPAVPVVPAPTLPAPPPVPHIELTSEALIQFGTRVQPILMNACASCHNEARGTAFRLERTYEIGVGNRKTLQQNVNAVLAYINVAQPQASPFLVKSVGVHWTLLNPSDAAQAPFKNRHAPAFRALEDWVHLAIGGSPPPIEAPAAPPPTPAPEPRPVPVVPTERGPDVSPARPVETTPSASPMPAPAPKPPSAPDPYGADEFNQRNHPNRVQEPRPK